MNSDTTWFRRGLATRVDALEVALKALADGDSDAESTIQHVARSLMEPARDYGFPAICQVAERVQQSEPQDLNACASALVKALRAEVAKAGAPASNILVVGGDTAFNSRLLRELGGAGREVLHADTGQQALDLIAKRQIALTILNLVLPDMDGRKLLTQLRSSPKTSSLCVLVLAKKLSRRTREGSLAIEANGCIEGPVEPDQVSAWVKSRLRRSHETAMEARRDGLTGLLNRGALLDSSTELVEACRASKEPLAVAILSIDHPADAGDSYDTRKREEIVQRAASLLSTSLRATDLLARWSTDEFAALFPAEDQFGGACAVQKVLAKLAKETFHGSHGDAFSVGLSAGISVVHGDKSLDDAMGEADHYLFEAKSSGGGRVIYSPSPIARHPGRVLIAHDDDLTARVMKNLLDKEGFEITHLTSVQEANDAASGARRFHLILIGETVAETSGFDLLSNLRRAAHNSRIPIVMLLHKNSEDSMVEALNLGANDYLTRPFDPFNFMAHMRRLVTRGRRSEHAAASVRRVLVVDQDTKALLMSASALHHRGGFRTYLSRDLEEATERVAECEPDLLLIAQGLATADTAGLDRLLARAGLEDASVVLSADEDDRAQDKDTAKALASREFRGPIPKPFDALTLGQKVEDALGVAPSPARPDDAADQLSREIQRIMTRG